MTTKFTPLYDRILVRREDEVGRTRGGLVIPDSAKDKPLGGQGHFRWQGQDNEKGKLFPRGEGRRPHSVRQVLGHRNQDWMERISSL